METQAAVSATNVLIQSAEAVIPKQKKVVAVKEFKHAKVSHKRHKDRQEKGFTSTSSRFSCARLQFIRSQILTFCIICMLTWNSAASDNHVWSLLYSACCRDTCIGTSIDRRRTFKEKYEGGSVDKCLFDRGFCEQCKAIVWLNNMNCPNPHGGTNPRNHLRPASPGQIMEYVLDGTLIIVPSSESDSDNSDDKYLSTLWAPPRFLV